MSDNTLAVQKAIYTTLTAALYPVKVYDAVPQGAAYPYVVINNTEVVSADFLSSRKDERILYLSIWSQYRGQKEVIDILTDIDAAIHRKALTLESGTMVQSFVQNKSTMREPDNLTFQGSAKLRIITQH